MARPVIAILAASAFLASTLHAPSAAASTSVPNWESMSVDISGAAGTWALVYQPFPAEANHADFWVLGTINSTAPTGVPLGILMGHSFVENVSGTTSIDGIHHATLSRQLEGGEYNKGVDVGEFSYGGAYVGVAFLVGSTAPWHANLTVGRDSAKSGIHLSAPAFTSTGSGISFVPRATKTARVAGLPSPDGLSTFTIRTNFTTPGWTHLQTYRTQAAPEGTREDHVNFANGRAYDALHAQASTQICPARGAPPPITPCVGGPDLNSAPTCFGEQGDAAGAFTAAFQLNNADTSFDAAVMHLPMTAADFPPGISPTGYSGYGPDDSSC